MFEDLTVAGLYHIGVVKALLEEKLIPKVISGSSVGSLIASLVGCNTDEDLKQFFFREIAFRGRRFLEKKPEIPGKVFEKQSERLVAAEAPSPPHQGRSDGCQEIRGSVAFPDWRCHIQGGVSAVVVLQHLFSRLESRGYEHTGRVLNITVAPQRRFEMPASSTT